MDTPRDTASAVNAPKRRARKWLIRIVAFLTGGAATLATERAIQSTQSNAAPVDGPSEHALIPVYEYYDDGLTIATHNSVLDGYLEGRFFRNWPDGKRAITGWYRHGQKVGLWSYHNEDGQAIVLREYIDGKAVDVVNIPAGTYGGQKIPPDHDHEERHHGRD